MTTPPVLLGEYATPRFRIGTVVNCERRGEVRIVGLSDAPIPWPVAKTLPKGRKPGLVLFDGLAAAVRRESATAVAYWWGVTAQTVTLWRKALEVGSSTEGTTRLRSEVHAPILEAARELAAPKQSSPERREKIAASKRGKPRPAHVIEAMRKGRTGKPHDAEARRKMSEAQRARRGSTRNAELDSGGG